MIARLPDVNVLVALAWPNHVHHQSARRWFRELGAATWATTPITEAGFVRISSNAAAMAVGVSPREATELLFRFRERPNHRFLVDDVELITGSRSDLAEEMTGHGQVTDLHLLALAERHGVRLATFDQGIARIAAARSIEIEILSPR